MSLPVIIHADRLSKKFGGVQAVKDLSFSVREGSIFGLLGRNGMGKTTTIRLLLGLLQPDSGSSSIFGEDSLELSFPCRKRIGYLSEEPFEFDGLPLPQLIKFVSSFFDSWDLDYTRHLIQRMSVPTDKPLDEMSVGERRKAELLLVLAQRPDLLILDDPAAGLDTTVRREFLWAALEVAREEGKAVLFTSHILTDVERVVDTVGILDKGSMRLLGPLDDVKSRVKRLVISNATPVSMNLAKVSGEISRKESGHDLVLITDSFDPQVVQSIRKRGCEVHVEDLNLEDIFCELFAEVPAEATS